MRGEWLVVGALTFVCGGDALARDKADIPSAEMLEFLGTYETAGKKSLDPMDLRPPLNYKKNTSIMKSRPTKAENGKTKKKGTRL